MPRGSTNYINEKNTTTGPLDDNGDTLGGKDLHQNAIGRPILNRNSKTTANSVVGLFHRPHLNCHEKKVARARNENFE